MPNWLLPALALLAIAGFVFFAFRQGMKVDRDDRHDGGPSVGGGPD